MSRVLKAPNPQSQNEIRLNEVEFLRLKERASQMYTF